MKQMCKKKKKIGSSDGLRKQLQKEIKDLQCSTERWKHGVTELNELLAESSENSAVMRTQTRTSAHIPGVYRNIKSMLNKR